MVNNIKALTYVILILPMGLCCCMPGAGLIPGEIAAYGCVFSILLDYLSPAFNELQSIVEATYLPAWMNDCLDDGAKVDMEWYQEARNAAVALQDETQQVISIFEAKLVLQTLVFVSCATIAIMYCLHSCKCHCCNRREQSKVETVKETPSQQAQTTVPVKENEATPTGVGKAVEMAEGAKEDPI